LKFRGTFIDPQRPATTPEVAWADSWAGKVVLITGVAGTVGREVLTQISQQPVRSIIGLDNNESALFFLEHAFKEREHASFELIDVCDLHSLIAAMEAVDIVIHTAALKHVASCERSPRAAIQTNIIGTQNVIQAALTTGIERLLLTSSDKAVNPTSVMGTSKLMAERLVTAANMQSRSGRTILASSRFGNVLGSNGSVIPLFRQQIAAGGPVTLTDPSMTRFIMTLSQAVSLVIDAVFLAKGGEVFVSKMPVCRIADLAILMIEELAPRYGRAPKDIAIQVVGPKPGEKFYEELVNDEEIRRVIELEDHFVVMPALYSNSIQVNYVYPKMIDRVAKQAYNSASVVPLSRELLLQFLRDNNFFE
jgi:FlaA1/EpsC-like NDP-sugar epimerase